MKHRVDHAYHYSALLLYVYILLYCWICWYSVDVLCTTSCKWLQCYKK